MASRLEEATADLDIDEEDVDRIKRVAFRRKLLTSISILLISLLSFIGGFVAAGGFARPEPVSSYPYVAGAASIFNYKPLGRTRITILGTILVSATAFIVGLVLGGDELEIFGYGTMYGVFHS